MTYAGFTSPAPRSVLGANRGEESCRSCDDQTRELHEEVKSGVTEVGDSGSSCDATEDSRDHDSFLSVKSERPIRLDAKMMLTPTTLEVKPNVYSMLSFLVADIA